MGILSGKNVIITGGSRGIGAGIAEELANAGANIIFTYLSSEERAKKVEEKLSATGSKAKGYQSNAAVFSECEAFISKVLEDFGQIDCLINNAGVTRDNLLLRMNEEQWDTVMDINLKSVFNMTKQVIRPMMKNGGGSIINISSVVGIQGNAGQANYAASKSGIIGFTKSVAQELGSRAIRCNAIAPGFIETEMTDQLTTQVREEYLKRIPMRRFGSTKEVGNVCLFLASDLSAYVSGQVISVCGAMST